MRFICCPNLMFLASPWLEIFKLVILLTFSSSELEVNLLNLAKSKGPSLFIFNDIRQITDHSLGKMLRLKKQSKPLHLTEIQEPPIIWSATSHFQWFIQQKSGTGWVPKLINKFQRLSLLFLTVTHFPDFCNKIKYAW